MQPQELLEKWGERVRRAQIAHYASATRSERRHYWLGLPVVILTTLIGTSAFASIQSPATLEMKIAVGIASVAAAILAAVQTFLRYSERAEAHRIAAVKFGGLKKEIEYMLTFFPTEALKTQSFAEDILKRWNELNEKSPTADPVLFARVFRKADQSSDPPNRSLNDPT
jgi:hypothetical protein